jgi:uncharacterized protein YbjQ (UPF0145 family)/sporulation protein YlmC with PRC-barrel domain
MVAVKKFLVEKRWALIAILIGVFYGFGSAILCIAFNLVIFGFNIMYIVSPLLAGFVEVFIARRRYGKSTGAISALLTFLLINGYGWFGPGLIFPKEPATLSLITIIAIILTLQAAFPTLINYILFVVGVGIVRKFIEFLIFLPSRILRKPTEAREIEENIGPSADEIFLDELKIPLLSVTPIEGGKIKKYVGLVSGEAVSEEKEAEGRISKLTKIIEPTLLEDMYLGDARKLAISRMLEEAESIGANTVIDVIISYVSMGGLQGSALLVTATGTAVIVHEENDKFQGKIAKKGPISGINEKVNVPKVNEIVSGDAKNASRMNEKVNVPKVNRNVSRIADRVKVSGQIIGKEVIDSSAKIIGKVKDIEVNLDNNEIEAIVFSKGSISESLGLSKEEVVIPFEEVKQIGDKILIKKNHGDKSSVNDYYSYIENKIRNIE